MLSKILKKETCAKCRWCCRFLDEEKWELPVIEPRLENFLHENKIKAEFEAYENKKIFKTQYIDIDDEHLINCPMLTETGCKLKDNKPFECRIWPFRVLKRNDDIMIAMSSGCKHLRDFSIKNITDFLDDAFIDEIRGIIKTSPEIIKDYHDDYIIFKIL